MSDKTPYILSPVDAGLRKAIGKAVKYIETDKETLTITFDDDTKLRVEIKKEFGYDPAWEEVGIHVYPDNIIESVELSVEYENIYGLKPVNPDGSDKGEDFELHGVIEPFTYIKSYI